MSSIMQHRQGTSKRRSVDLKHEGSMATVSSRPCAGTGLSQEDPSPRRHVVANLDTSFELVLNLPPPAGQASDQQVSGFTLVLICSTICTGNCLSLTSVKKLKPRRKPCRKFRKKSICVSCKLWACEMPTEPSEPLRRDKLSA